MSVAPGPALRVSVIMPVFNGARYIGAALASVLAQTAPPVEVILIDDGSTDDSAEVLRALVETNPGTVPIRILTQENAGQSAARNNGAALARGELIAFLDQDDRWYPEHLAVLAAPFASQPELGWAYSEFDEIDGSDFVVTRDFLARHGRVIPRVTLHELIAQDIMVLPSASILRASVFAEVGGFDPQFRGYEDDDLFIRIFRLGWRSHFEPRALTYFRVHANSSSGRNLFRESRMRFFEKMRLAVPDDTRLNRHYVSDLLAPRLLYSTVTEYSQALSARDDVEARAIAVAIVTLISVASPTSKARLGLQILGNPPLTRAILRALRVLPRVLRPKLHPALVLRG
jgi:glycosyltransferase involved in cell wall biosynthesis